MIKDVLKSDPELANLIKKEDFKQNNTINLIASESFAPREILELQGSILTNKAVEGYPRARFHSGCEWFDQIEILAMERAKKLFKAEHANVQPHSGVNANLAVYMAFLEPGETILSMNIKHGGHLSHGSKASLTGKYYKPIYYGVDKTTGLIDYEEIRTLSNEHRPKMIITGGSSYPREIDYSKLREIADEVGAYFLVDLAHVSGLVAGEVLNNPIYDADFVTSTCYKTLCGSQGGFILTKKEFAKKIDKAVFPQVQGSSCPQIIAAKAFTFKRAMTDEFRKLAKQMVINAKTLAEKLENMGFDIITKGTDTHIVMINLGTIGLTGQAVETKLASEGILTNKNLIPFDPQPPSITSGIRIGTTAMTCKGAKEAHFEKIGEIICKIAFEDNKRKEIKEEIKSICSELNL